MTVSAPSPGLRAGAAKIDVTPEPLPERFRGVRDPVFVRALVLDDGRTRAALVSVDIIGLGTEVCTEVAAQVAERYGIAADHLLVSATHTHSVPDVLGARWADAMVSAVGEAVAALRPAELAVGTGRSAVNVNRNLFDAATAQWREGRNDAGPSDQTVGVLRLTEPGGGVIAVVQHYAVHAVVTGMQDLISADLPGVATRHVEQALGDGAVSLWFSGCAGDQNPVFYQQTLDLRAHRIAAYNARGEDIANAMPPGGEGLDRDDPVVARLFGEQDRLVEAMGTVLGEEVIAVCRERCDRPLADVRIGAAEQTVTLPGRRRTDTGRAGRPGTYVDAEPVPLRVGLLRLGDILLGHVDAELFTEIGQRWRREAPAKHAWILTLTGGRAPSGYVASNTAGGYLTFEVLSSRLQPGHAEAAIVDALADLSARTAAVG
ncbi:hypothetical protein FHX74_002392 [Friedmanniella endophytica]|uniref:Neutral/alkaline non-lysosomal ceramidase N-terminal domain-containing protein n=1 Tax=Microlunatus kandeliicorticis TaxID=1759536 RepID=A0A7W3P6A5_9ACTN|nr:hypothetical protein [Microlunatus kandeliicorticis]MBA8794773.1 hypothetical protein [Microlunatus kandeliicorticis]